MCVCGGGGFQWHGIMWAGVCGEAVNNRTSKRVKGMVLQDSHGQEKRWWSDHRCRQQRIRWA